MLSMLQLIKNNVRRSLFVLPFLMVNMAFVMLLVIPTESAQAKSPANQAMADAFQNLSAEMNNNNFNEPLHIASTFKDNNASGEIYALINNSFSNVSTHLINPVQWCDMLVLHVNVKGCYEVENSDSAGQGVQETSVKGTNSSSKIVGALSVFVGRKYYQPIEDAHEMKYQLSVNENTDDYLQTTLSASEGPFGTSEYKLVFEAIPLANNKTFIHFSYSYHYGFLAKVALSGYLATIGRSKVGFTVDKFDDNKNPVYVKGMQGIVERNSMRYFIAIRAYLDTITLKSKEWTSRINHWYELALPYKRQLHEVKDKLYLKTKQEEFEKKVTLETALLKKSERSDSDNAW